MPAGDRVAGMIPWHLTRGAPGAYAEFVAADRDWLAPVPHGVDLATAATVPLNALTAHRAVALMALPATSTVLVTGASGGVGGFAAQLLVRAGHRVIAVASHADEDWVGGLGVAEQLTRATASAGAQARVQDAGPVAGRGRRRRRGRRHAVDHPAYAAVRPARSVPPDFLLVQPAPSSLRVLLIDVAKGDQRTRVAATLPLAEAADAHRMVSAGGLRGKVVLVP